MPAGSVGGAPAHGASPALTPATPDAATLTHTRTPDSGCDPQSVAVAAVAAAVACGAVGWQCSPHGSVDLVCGTLSPAEGVAGAPPRAVEPLACSTSTGLGDFELVESCGEPGAPGGAGLIRPPPMSLYEWQALFDAGWQGGGVRVRVQ